MFDTTESQTRLTTVAWGTAFATLVIGQLHALARHRTEDGRSDLDLPATALWAEPAGRALDPLLSWAGPDTVYLAYGKWWALAIGVMVAAGVMVMRLRAPYGAERWGWRLFLAGHALLVLGVAAFYWGQWTSYNVMDDIGLWMQLPGALLGSIGATVLGIVLLRRKAQPKLAAVLLLLNIPAMLVITEITSLGNAGLPAMFAVAMLAGAETRKVATERAGLSTDAVPATQ